MMRYVIVPSALLILLVLISASTNYGASARTEMVKVMTESNQIGNPIWTLGKPDDSDLEFGKESAAPISYTVSSGEQQQQTWSSVPQGLNKSLNPTLSINYALAEIPEYGVHFRVKILDAHKSVPEMAVFSNNLLSGIIQIAGVGGTTSAYEYKKLYELYIPKEQLQLGNNVLKLSAEGCLSCKADENKFLWWKWDYLSLDALTAPAEEPIHGRYVESGTKVSNLSFYYDQGAVRHLPYVLKWLGIAYSGNVMRVDCATDVKEGCSAIKPYYETLRDYNTQAVALHLHTGNIKLNDDGTLPADAENKLSDYVKQYGSMFQYYEIDNEPGLFNRSKSVNLAIAKWLKINLPELAPHVKTVAPGWAYAPQYSMRSCRNQNTSGVLRCGDPDGWESDPNQRMELEEMTDLTNGHAYGTSYVNNKDGSFLENMRTFGGAKDGLQKLMLNTEYGTSDSHKDPVEYGAAEPHAAVFDRIMRAHIGYADMFMQHAAFYPDYALFEPGIDLNTQNPAQMQIHKNSTEEDTRVGVMRRLNLAYATHGKPLVYEISNKQELSDKLVYFRGVDTSTLPALPGSGGKSDKILLNFVNFESSPQTIQVKVTMPEAALYEGERFGAGDTYESARSYLSGLQADTELDFKETLGPGEAVQYILSRADGVKKVTPTWIQAKPVQHHAIELSWKESEVAQSYDILRKSGGSESSYEVIAEQVQGTEFVDTSTVIGNQYEYQIRLSGTNEVSQPASAIATDSVALDRKDWEVTSSSGKPQGAIDGNIYSRWDTGVAQAPGQFYQVDMKTPTTINRIRLRSEGSPNDYPRKYEVYVSTDGYTWSQPIATGSGSSILDINFSPTYARFVKIIQTMKAGNYWSIHDLQIYG
ncbi:discoidin domain-containing protein [Paenibacillus chondroitinus]|uniref:Discoidin domain-containing protein n=1 Tax=Paenibacillus chondroitinus TaxID=59842 RepID=A0ABU6DBR1_9BACL|nr:MULTISPECIES: discoidin domain-containing protein [Paenibacillus]MCY9656678.1 discoidin domain-containing protein [Paenibacillus anseongense]MEB4794327.1 discoidin domain-containing protein [Paenibacillus chondroitinus]